MRSNYRKIWDLIHLVDERNKWLHVSLLLWLTIAKKFIPSVANIVWTDMENYKIIRKNQFACSLMQVRRDKKIPVALLQEYDEAIISQAYPIFEVNDEKELLPEYLMMWFSREEFDREACFYAVGGVRGSLEWEDFCSMHLPVPDITKQQEIIDEYNTIKDRITLNNWLIGKLEETAQAVYREWFVDGIDMENLPSGWKISSLSKIANYLNGLAMQNFESKANEDFLPVIKIRELNLWKTDENSWKAKINIPKEYIIENWDVIFSWSWSLVVDIWAWWKWWLNQHLFKVSSDNYPKRFFYLWTKHHLDEFIKIADGNKTSMWHIKREHLDNAKVLIPDEKKFEKVNAIMSPILDQIILRKFETRNLEKMKDLILSKMASEG